MGLTFVSEEEWLFYLIALDQWKRERISFRFEAK